MAPYIILAFIALVAVIIWRWKPSRVITAFQLTDEHRQILQQQVLFYQRLDEKEKLRFEQKLVVFLREVRIQGIGTDIDETDRIFVAASAVIPIFGFPEWQYRNLTDVLIYPDTFNEEFQFEGKDRAILGMVGSGYMNGKMILSRHALRQGFEVRSDKSNTAIHEFVHLLDKSDGAVDGIPENLLQHQYTIPWLHLMQQQIEQIKANRSDINPYAATDKSEFFAVVSEYFFERPELLQQKHPELYDYLEKIFNQSPAER
ncbi:MAG: zinc-dependent peptidase [Candidatus Pseudobacter hemicellulosilyticus]|uniref:Zinc-dependent peptidase n=1 Tax=Candidatus Pseudobacter hemicellulosilyticus TaxID=3121375 RepID=A0AAJ5X0Z4_9BACT|nr:MAG: zinc-dependent peptidase [Pseudobacter sp.]